jgi:hypothetical protein
MSASVMPNEIQWPIVRAAAETVPLTSPMTRAGQHLRKRKRGVTGFEGDHTGEHTSKQGVGAAHKGH